MSQCSEILKHLRTGKTLTQMGALNRFGCMRLGARILDLRNQGHAINSEMVTANEKTFAKYSLGA